MIACMWQVYNQDSVMQSVLSSAVRTVMGSQGSLLGAGRLEVSPLIAGGAHLIDTWVELEVRRSFTVFFSSRSLEVLGKVGN